MEGKGRWELERKERWEVEGKGKVVGEGKGKVRGITTKINQLEPHYLIV